MPLIPIAARFGWTRALGGKSATPITAEDDFAIVRRFKRTGDEELFSLLVARHKERVHRTAASILGPGLEEEAEDLTQEVFILVFRKLHSFRGECAFSTWLLRLTRNLAIDRRRQPRQRRPHLPEEVLEYLPHARGDGNPEITAMKSQRLQRVLDCIEGLPDPQRTVVYLYYWMGRPIAEIAELLELNPETAKSHLHRSRRRLAERLK